MAAARAFQDLLRSELQTCRARFRSPCEPLRSALLRRNQAQPCAASLVLCSCRRGCGNARSCPVPLNRASPVSSSCRVSTGPSKSLGPPLLVLPFRGTTRFAAVTEQLNRDAFLYTY